MKTCEFSKRIPRSEKDDIQGFSQLNVSKKQRVPTVEISARRIKIMEAITVTVLLLLFAMNVILYHVQTSKLKETVASLTGKYERTYGVGLEMENYEDNLTKVVSLLYEHHIRLRFLEFDKTNHSLALLQLDKRLTNAESNRRGDLKILHEQEKKIEMQNESSNHILSVLEEQQNILEGQNNTLEKMESKQILNLKNLKEHQTRLSKLESKPVVGFTARYKSNYLNGALTYSYVVTSIGGGFNPNTGVFTCPVSGYYLVSTTLQLENDGNAYCYLVKNGSSTGIEIDINGKSQEPGSQTVVLHLNKGDMLRVGNCVNPNLIGDETTFSAILIDPTSG